MDSLRIGVVGLGGVAAGWGHLPRLKDFQDVEIAALCDKDGDRLSTALGKYAGRGYRDVREMLDGEQLDAVWVCVPPFAHGEVEREIAQRGVHMFIEKPVELSVERALETADALDEAGVMVSVGYMLRYADLTERLRRELADRRPALMMGRYFCPLPPKDWWKQKRLSGGQTVEQITHIYDLARYLFGEPESVRAWAHHGIIEQSESCDIDDGVAAQIRFGDGTLASICNAVTLEKGWHTSVEVVAEGRLYEYHFPGNLTIHNGETEQLMAGEDAFTAEDRAFVNAVKTGDGSLIRSPYRDAVESLRLSLAINEAAETGMEVGLG